MNSDNLVIIGLTVVALAAIGGVVKGCQYSYQADEIRLQTCIPSVTLLDEPSGQYERHQECSPGAKLVTQPHKDGKVHVICECPDSGELTETD